MALIPRVARESTAFLLCDIQERFRNSIVHFPSVIHVATTMTQAAGILNVPLIVTEHVPQVFGKTLSEISAVYPRNTNIFSKTKFSMATPEVASFLTAGKFRSVVLFGIEAHVCLQQTALDLVSAGYGVHVLADGSSSSRQFERTIAFDRLRQVGVTITSSESMLFELMQDAKYENFKSILELVKRTRPDSGL
ncbi:isochorismatase domain-containing protein 1 [Capsaspora owczarzaki ATCC 30864]|uniref:Isochorismatase domain-containing protein 1 n=1 Tax=Capsaspora owczarzaki (strain ATCC 30864) TaxID=595528 RepID=A0A0D2WQI1_CAPO3|nr:isochorismatase domain-containing protein 1 [Capsaspora owczarzaki ATCC 30864]KJE93178.1 isochorismatase domain-containing protein 1 [Capsaspora owczarzaki ATCC 30864]|eukprot:XP_004347829.1 isochorismatase domain-containing protein 1 [Capsaspora owczarzaki ATCC 30864]